jgi:hypothetical protein
MPILTTGVRTMNNFEIAQKWKVSNVTVAGILADAAPLEAVTDNMPTFSDDDAGRKAFALGYNAALATQVSPQATVEPLTDEQIEELAMQFQGTGDYDFDAPGFARALLAATPTASSPSAADILLADRIQNFADWLEPIQKAVLAVAATWSDDCEAQIDKAFDAAAIAVCDGPMTAAVNNQAVSNIFNEQMLGGTGGFFVPTANKATEQPEDPYKRVFGIDGSQATSKADTRLVPVEMLETAKASGRAEGREQALEEAARLHGEFANFGLKKAGS